MKVRIISLTAMIACLLSVMSAQAEDPEYLSLAIGTAVEVSGEWDNKDSAFVAGEIELLPAPRRPKLRGAIQATDSVSHTIQLFGQWIDVTDKTQFIKVDETSLGFAILTQDRRIEASCKVDSTGRWLARHLRVRGVKDSDKIKGTITSTEFNGSSPDYLEVEGLRILVHDETVLFKTLGATAPEKSVKKDIP